MNDIRILVHVSVFLSVIRLLLLQEVRSNAKCCNT